MATHHDPSLCRIVGVYPLAVVGGVAYLVLNLPMDRPLVVQQSLPAQGGGDTNKRESQHFLPLITIHQ